MTIVIAILIAILFGAHALFAAHGGFSDPEAVLATHLHLLLAQLVSTVWLWAYINPVLVDIATDTPKRNEMTMANVSLGRYLSKFHIRSLIIRLMPVMILMTATLSANIWCVMRRGGILSLLHAAATLSIGMLPIAVTFLGILSHLGRVLRGANLAKYYGPILGITVGCISVVVTMALEPLLFRGDLSLPIGLLALLAFAVWGNLWVEWRKMNRLWLSPVP